MGKLVLVIVGFFIILLIYLSYLFKLQSYIFFMFIILN
jgi:hypothetical protein